MFEPLAAVMLTVISVGSAAMARYAPTHRDNLLDHSFRLQIKELVEKNPGIGKAQLRRGLGCSWGTIHHHMALLVQEGFIMAAIAGRRTSFFPAEMNKVEVGARLALKHGRAAEFARIVLRNPGLKQQEVAAGIDISRKVLRPYIERLTRAGLLQEVREDGCCRYHPTPRLATIMERIGGDELHPQHNRFSRPPQF